MTGAEIINCITISIVITESRKQSTSFNIYIWIRVDPVAHAKYSWEFPIHSQKLISREEM